MTYKLTTYRTLTGTKEVLETLTKKSTEWIVYKDDKPAYYVDCFDLQTASNVLMNNLILCEQQDIKEVLKEISKKYQVNLSIKKPPLIEIEVASRIEKIKLPPLPEAWLQKM